MGCVQLAGLTLAASAMGLGVLLVGVSLYRVARGMAVIPAVLYAKMVAIFVLVPALLIVTVLDHFKIDPLPGWCGAPLAP